MQQYYGLTVLRYCNHRKRMQYSKGSNDCTILHVCICVYVCVCVNNHRKKCSMHDKGSIRNTYVSAYVCSPHITESHIYVGMAPMTQAPPYISFHPYILQNLK